MKIWFLSALLTAMTAVSACCQYTGPWLTVWDFDSGQQGWTINGVDADWRADAGVSGSGGLYLPNTSYATINSSLRLGGNWGQDRFVLEADVYVSDAGNFLQGSGISAMRAGDGKGPAVYGNSASTKGVAAIDRTWDATTKNLSYVFEQPAGKPAIVPMWIKLQIDYGFSAPGYWSSFVYIPAANARGAAGWYTIGLNRTINPDVNQTFPTIRLGSLVASNPVGWSQARFDNVRLAPEPSGLLSLVAGMGVLLRAGKLR